MKQKFQVWETVHYQWLVDADTEAEAIEQVWKMLENPDDARAVSHDVYGADCKSYLRVEQEEGYA